MTKRDYILRHAMVHWMFELPKQVHGFSTTAVSTTEWDDLFEAAEYEDEIPHTEVIYHVVYEDGTKEDIRRAI